jgi:hypothetical protein
MRTQEERIAAIFRRFGDAMIKANKTMRALKLAWHKERNRALAKGKHNLKRPRKK